MQNFSINEGISIPSILVPKTLIDLFTDTVSKFGNKNALSFNNQSLTYTALNNASNHFAEELIAKGIGKHSIVGIYLPRSLDLFIAIIGVLKSGAGYVPFDSETPIERVSTVLNEIGSTFCISNKIVNEQIFSFNCEKIQLTETAVIDFSTPSSIAYIIFTSGSTGKPKGIPIKHAQIAHLVQSEQAVLAIQSKDIVYQGFSVSFDMWMEEVWVSIFAAASIVVADELTAKTFDRLDQFLNDHKVTVLHAVPSLLALIESNIPSIRLINAGGEACTQNVLQKWAKKDIAFFNSYGPTETTVSASFKKLLASDTINIGYPIPNYSMAVVDELNNPVEIGKSGELVIAGIGLSQGYLNNVELSAKVFLPKPASLSVMKGDRIYLSGDLATMNNDGSFNVIGRKDDQVKIRGYRVELGEIEAKLNELNFIQSAAVVVRNINSIDQLVAFVLPKNDTYNEKLAKEILSKFLPAYMIPSLWIKIEAFTYLTSGKIDKKSLTAPSTQKLSIVSDELIQSYAADPFNYAIVKVLANLFPGQEIVEQTDFFTDLGGHSLLAANFISAVRNIEGLEQVSIIDIYQKRTIGAILKAWHSSSKTAKTTHKVKYSVIPNIRYYTCWLAQSFALVFIYGLVGAQIFIPYLGYYVVANEVNNIYLPIFSSILLFCTVTPLIILIAFFVKKYIIGNFKEGVYPLWGIYYFKWWLYKKILDVIPIDTICNTLLYPSFLNRIGLKTGPDAQLSKIEFGAPDLITIGNNVTISANVILHNAHVENGLLYLKKITIKSNAYIGTGSIINGGCILEEGAELKDLSCINENTIIPAYQIWEGSPAKFLQNKETYQIAKPVSKIKRRKFKIIFLLIVASFPLLIILPLIPSIIGFHYLDDNADWYSFTYLLSTPLFSLLYIILFLSEVILLSKIAKNFIKEGRYSIYSRVYLIKWFTEQLFSLLLIVIKPIFATVYISSIYRALGAKVGKNTEISTASNISHHLLEIGDESFIADVAVIGETDIRNQEMILQKTSIGNKSFIGNSAQIPQGYHLGNNKLIGVLSVPPVNNLIDPDIASDWFGSPAIQLPKREIKNNYPAHLTYQPSYWRKFARACVEFIRILIPQSIIFSLSILFIAYAHDLLVDKQIETILLFFPFYYIGIVAIPAFLITFILKWLIIGKYKNAEYPMFTWQVWRSEAVTSFYEALAVPFFLEFLEGTPYLPIMLRLLGVKIGKKVWMDTADITEFDMVSIGDNTSLNKDCGPQTHLFEDRVMKIGSISIGAKCTIGAGSIILYNSVIENNTTIGSLSLVMKAEHLPANAYWQGIPIQKNINL